MDPAKQPLPPSTPEGFDRSLDEQAFLPEEVEYPHAVQPPADASHLTSPPAGDVPLPSSPPAQSAAGAAPSAEADQVEDQAKALLKGWTWDTVSMLIVGGGAALFLGAFMTWAKVANWLSVSGTDGDGKLTLVLGLGAVGAGVYGLQRTDKRAIIGALVCAVLAFLIGGNAFLNISDTGDEFLGDAVSVGIGLWLTMLGAIASITGPAIYLKKGRI